ENRVRSVESTNPRRESPLRLSRPSRLLMVPLSKRLFAKKTIYACAPALAMMLGCGREDNLPREAVSGAVSIEGKPLKSGLITFLPAEDVPTQGGAPVVEGKYTIAQNQGLVPGKYRVVISSPEDKPEVLDKTNNAPGLPPVPRKEVIPAQYNN